MIKYINSLNNPLFKHLKKLTQKKFRMEYGEFLIEGERFTEEAVNQKADILEIISYDEELLKKLEIKYPQLPLLRVDKNMYLTLTQTINPQKIIARIKKGKICNINDLVNEFNMKDRVNIFYLDSIQDPGNLGTIIRSCHGFNIDLLLLSSGTCEVYQDKVLRSTMGSVFKVPFIESSSTETLRTLIEKGYSLYITDVNKEKSLREISMTEKNIIVIGNEGRGVSEEVKELPHEKISIPMPGEAESLNAAVASSIIMYELMYK